MKIYMEEIKNKLNEEQEFLERNYQVRRLGVFGSVARGDNNDKSDIDVLVEFSKPIGIFKFIQLENYLSKVLGKNVDLVTKNALKKTIKNEILRETSYV